MDPAHKHRISYDPVDRVSSGHVDTSCVASIVLVGPGYNLVIRPDCMVLGFNHNEDMRLALSGRDSLVDAVGKAVEKANGAR